MQNLNTIPVAGKFLDVANKANTNFLAIKTAIEQLELSVIRSKGFFSSSAALSAKYPSPSVGDWAVVQDTSVSPATVYIWRCTTNGTWSNSGTEWPGGNVDLSEYVQIASIVDEPIRDSGDPISAGGAWGIKDSVTSDISKEIRLGERLTETVSHERYDMPYDSTTHTCTVGSQKSNTTNNKKYHVVYFPRTFSKGDVIHIHGEASANKTMNFGFTVEDPSQRVSLTGLVVDNAFHYSGTFHDYDLIVPYDNAYLVYYFHTDSWISGTRVFSYYQKDEMKGIVKTLRSDVDNLEDNLEYDSLKIIEEDYTSVGTWRTGGTSAEVRAYSTVTIEDDVIMIQIIKASSGGRFGIDFSTFPIGDYRIEFDYEIVNSGGTSVERVFSNLVYNAYNVSDSAKGSRMSDYMRKYEDGHYVYRIHHLNTSGFYIAFTINGYFSAGDTMTVRNFHITKYDGDWNALKEEVDTHQEALDGMVDSLIKEKAVGTKEITLIPSASETYLAYKTSSGSQFISNSKRLLYFPKVEVAGGKTVTFRYSGLNIVDVYQLAEKESVDIDASPVGKYTVAEVMMDRKSFPSKVSPAWDGIEDSDGNITATFVAHKNCNRIAFVMGSTEDKTQTPSNISENILELTLSIYDGTQVDFSSFAKSAKVEELEERVSKNEIDTGILPPLVTVKKYEMAANGAISKKSSAYYRFVYFTVPLPIGTIIHFRGETDGTSRANRFAFVRTDPASVANPAALSPVDEVFELELESVGYDDDGNLVSRSYTKDITVTEEDVYLVYYFYNKNWKTRTITLTYPGALKSEIDNINEYRSGADKLISQAKLWKDSVNTSVETLGLIHFSDIHGDTVAAQKIAVWLDKYADYVDDLVNTGDVVYYDVDSGNNTAWWNNCGLAEKSLFVLGNHDCATKNATQYDQVEAQTSGRAWNGKGKAWAHNTFFLPYLSEWDATPPTGFNDSSSQHYKACYWHKDYEEAKVRIIGLDCMNYFDGVLDENLNIVTPGFKNPDNIGQEVWFAEKLAEAKTAGYSVVILCHYPLDDTDNTPGVSHANVLDANGCNTSPDGGFVVSRLTGETTTFTRSLIDDTTTIEADKRFCLRNKIGEDAFDPEHTWVNYSKGSTNNIGDILQRFIDGGGKFVAWLCGHYHGYHMFYPKKYPTVLTIVAGEAGNERPTYYANRPKNIPELRTLANYISIDTYYGWLKLVRLGVNTDRTLRSVQWLVYDYKKKKVISEG